MHLPRPACPALLAVIKGPIRRPALVRMLVFVALFLLHTPKFYSLFNSGGQHTENMYCEEAQPLLLFGTEARVKRLPRSGKLFEFG